MYVYIYVDTKSSAQAVYLKLLYLYVRMMMNGSIDRCSKCFLETIFFCFAMMSLCELMIFLSWWIIQIAFITYNIHTTIILFICDK